MAKPDHPDHAQMSAWVGDRLKPFDTAAATQRVGEAVGEVPQSVRLLLQLLDGGIKLTPAGRLPRSVVRAMHEHRPHWYPLPRLANLEEDLLPLAHLRDFLRHVRLVRLSNGVLAPTKAASNDLETVRRIRSWFDPQSFSTGVVERALAVLVDRGPLPVEELAAGVLPLLGFGWRRGGEPIDADDVAAELSRLSHVLSGLDLINRNRSEWAAGPSARSLVPGTGLIADCL